MLKYNKISSSGKRIYLLFCFTFFVLNFAFGQGGTWTWISGDSAANSVGVFGTQGAPSLNNHPPGMYEGTEWTDKQGNFWVYGGWNSPNMYSDLWKYNPVTNEWTWVKGNGLLTQNAIYGTKGVPNPANTPGSRRLASSSWVDTSGNFWLFGGDNGGGLGNNDLWKYDLANNNWTWMNGSDSSGVAGAYGVKGIPSTSNFPGTRNETCSAWTDSLNNLWLFGGYGMDAYGNFNCLNDLWRYNISTNEWTWMNGSDTVNFPIYYGSKGVAGPSNDPGARVTYTKWKDSSGNFWLMGGDYWDIYTYVNVFLNDMWKYDIYTNEWTWMAGSNIPNDSGSYIQNCIYNSSNFPASRYEHRSAVKDNCGNFWMFGGAGINDTTCYNDLWIFDPHAIEWNWLCGSNLVNDFGSYGVIGVPSANNIPASRWGALAWWGGNNKFYLFGGLHWPHHIIYPWHVFSDLWVFSPDTTCVSFSCSAVSLPPVADFQSDKTTVCSYDCINYTDHSNNATSWQWTFTGGSPSSSTDQNPQACYFTSGIYNVTLVASNSGGSDTLSINNYITVNAASATPVITQVHNDTLFCSTNAGYISYQWYLDSALLAGATDTFLVISKSGNYNIEVTNAAGCKTAVGINVVLGLQNYMSDHFVSLSPNPVGDKFTVYGLWFTVGRMEIYNVLGQVCQQSEIKNPKSEIDVSMLASGMYFVQIIGEKERGVGRFVKE